METTLTLEDLVAFCEANAKVTITFTKKDGTERVLNGTRKLDLIPEDKAPKPIEEGKEVKPPTVLRIFDLDIGEWRSITPSSVSKHEVMNVL